MGLETERLNCVKDREMIITEDSCRKCEDYQCPYCLNQPLINKIINQTKKRKIYRILAIIDFIIILIILQTLFVMLGFEHQIISSDPYIQILPAGIFTSIVPILLILFICYIGNDNHEKTQ